MFCIGARRVVALLRNLPAHRIPHLVQIVQLGAKDGLGIAPDLQLALACIDFTGGRAGLADKVAEFREAVLAQGGHHFRPLAGTHLQHHAQLFIEQGFEGLLLAPRTHLPCPVFAVAHVHAAVRNTVSFEHQHVHVERHAHPTGKGHLGHGG